MYVLVHIEIGTGKPMVVVCSEFLDDLIDYGAEYAIDKGLGQAAQDSEEDIRRDLRSDWIYVGGCIPEEETDRLQIVRAFKAPTNLRTPTRGT